MMSMASNQTGSVRVRPAQASRPTVCRCVARLAASSSSWRSAAPAHLEQLTFMTPGQFSSFHGSHMLLPSIYVSRAKPMVGPRMRMPPAMSFLGVGAPEALLVGIVALVVFGPKGLAEAAKSIGTTLRAFQPTIKEVVAVSQDIKGTLEKELGLDELRDAARVSPRSREMPEPPANMDEMMRSNTSNAGFAAAMSSDEDPDIEAKRRASASMAWANQPTTAGADAAAGSPGPAGPSGTGSSSGGSSGGGSVQQAVAPPPMVANIPGTLTQPVVAAAPAGLGSLSDAELEAELARRRTGQQTKA